MTSMTAGEGSHATFAPRGWKQQALAAYAAAKLGGHVEIEQVSRTMSRVLSAHIHRDLLLLICTTVC